ncbi:MAG: LysM peptidoglycan-binding domain-containing protein [Verrucomicrobiota bacterium]
MEDEELETSSGNNLLPTALAVLAILLGGAGLYFGLTANQRLNPLNESMEAGTTSAARIDKDIAALETQISELSAQNTELKKALDRMRLYSNQSEQAVKKVVSSVSDNRDEIVELVERLNEIATSGLQPSPAVSSSTGSTEVPAPAMVTTSDSGGTYTIKSGDTFARVASKLGVDLQDLLDVNTDADPLRLRIGQVIQVPDN